jgi:LacI family transcriptional regulator
LADAGRELAPDAVVLTDRSFEQAAQAAEALLSGPAAPDAIFAHTDELAAAAHLAAARLALRVPDDLAIVGFDDGVTAQALQLTTVRQPLRQTGEWAFRTLTAMIEDPTLAAPSLTFPVALVRRRSA